MNWTKDKPTKPGRYRIYVRDADDYCEDVTIKTFDRISFGKTKQHLRIIKGGSVLRLRDFCNSWEKLGFNIQWGYIGPLDSEDGGQ